MLLYIGTKFDFILEEIEESREDFEFEILRKEDITKIRNVMLKPLYDTVLIELNYLVNSIEEIVDILSYIRQMNTRLKIGFIAIDFSKYSNLVKEVKAVGYKSVFIENEKELNYSTLKEYILHLCDSSSDSVLDNNIDLNDINSNDKENEPKTYKKCVNIGIMGALRHIGTTTGAIQFVKYLQIIGYKSCYLELNDTDYVNTLSSAYITDNENEKNRSFIKYQSANLYNNLKSIDTIQDEYNFCVNDYGAFKDNTVLPSFLQSDIKLIVAGFKPTEIEAFEKVYKQLVKYGNIHYIFNFIAGKDRKDILNMMSDKKGFVHFLNYSPDPYVLNEDNKFFQDIINTLESKTEVKQKKKTVLRGVKLWT